MNDQDSKTPSTKSFDGCGGDTDTDTAKIKQESGDDAETSASTTLATCTFINRRASAVTVSVARGGSTVSNGTLYRAGDRWTAPDIRNGDCYCWNVAGPCNPDCSLRCYPGGAYYVG